MFLDPIPPEAWRLIRAAYPDYKGRKVSLSPETGPIRIVSYWDGGSRDYFAVVRLADAAVLPIPQNGTPFDGGPLPRVEVPHGCVIVEHSIFCGKDAGITLHVRAEDATPLLPPVTTLSWPERVVLTATASRKSSYGGVKDFRRHEARRETGITDTEYDAALAECQRRGLLNGQKAITASGRNSLGDHYPDLYRLKRPTA